MNPLIPVIKGDFDITDSMRAVNLHHGLTIIIDDSFKFKTEEGYHDTVNSFVIFFIGNTKKKELIGGYKVSEYYIETFIKYALAIV